MNNRRKIGFQAYYDNTQNPEEDEQKKEQAERQKAIAEFIGHNYSPIGTCLLYTSPSPRDRG